MFLKIVSVYFAVIIHLNYFTIFSLAEEVSEEPSLDLVSRGEVQSCRGCSLNRLPNVRSFIYDDLPKYAGVEFHPIQGAVPHLVLFDESDKELKRINLSDLSQEECNKLASKWFSLKEESHEDSREKVREEL